MIARCQGIDALALPVFPNGFAHLMFCFDPVSNDGESQPTDEVHELNQLPNAIAAL